ncbi:MAG: hypothetical protein VYA30_09150 [Myxococcota bacterium]|nr:hypothetical protein [Myxococcota bacterium]
MQSTIKFGFVLILLSCGACSDTIDPTVPDGAMHLLRDAIAKRDFKSLIGQLSQRTRIDLDTSVKLLNDQRQAIQAFYPPEYKIGALGVYPRAIFAAQNSHDLMKAYLAERLRKHPPSAGLQFGLTSRDRGLVVDGRATITTHSGEQFVFVKEEAEWKSTVFEATVGANLDLLKANQTILEENLSTLKAMKKAAD